MVNYYVNLHSLYYIFPMKKQNFFSVCDDFFREDLEFTVVYNVIQIEMSVLIYLQSVNKL